MNGRRPDLERQLGGDLQHLRLVIFYEGPGHYQVESEDGHRFYMVHVNFGPMPPVTERILSEQPGAGVQELLNAAEMVLLISNGAGPHEDMPDGYLRGGPLPEGRYFTRRLDNYDEFRVRMHKEWPELQGWLPGDEQANQG